MADAQHIAILREGAPYWNSWRNLHPEITPDLTSTDLCEILLSGPVTTHGMPVINGLDLRRANLEDASLSQVAFQGGQFSRANLKGAKLRLAILHYADFTGAILSQADLTAADLSGATLSGANLRRTRLVDAKLTAATLEAADLYLASLISADLSAANLTNASLERADLTDATLVGCLLNGADLRHAAIGSTVFGALDLSEVQGLSLAFHFRPSTIGIDTLTLSHGKIPTAFLQGCGLRDWEIEAAKLYSTELGSDQTSQTLYNIHYLLGHQAIQVSPVFISYSHSDGPFVEKLEEHLNAKGIRFWRDVHDATSGRLEKQIDRAIRLNPTVLLVLSTNSVESDWVQHEVQIARKVEKELKRDVLCPITIDTAWKSCHWPDRVMEQVREYNILDFANWEDETVFGERFERLIKGLLIFYGDNA